MERDSMVIMAAWFDKFKLKLTQKQMKEVCFAVVNYGLWREKYHSDDVSVDVILGFLYEQIERMQNSYDSKLENSKKAGRPKKVNDVEIHRLASQGMRAKEIAATLNIASVKTVYSSEGWKNKDNLEYFSENYFSQNSENYFEF